MPLNLLARCAKLLSGCFFPHLHSLSSLHFSSFFRIYTPSRPLLPNALFLSLLLDPPLFFLFFSINFFLICLLRFSVLSAIPRPRRAKPSFPVFFLFLIFFLICLLRFSVLSAIPRPRRATRLQNPTRLSPQETKRSTL